MEKVDEKMPCVAAPVHSLIRVSEEKAKGCHLGIGLVERAALDEPGNGAVLALEETRVKRTRSNLSLI